ncbi:MAG: GGDEF domain-containing protein [Oscillospiraceae bacterium]|nr:GGDEF domain-containing protein [Oscillospiraceae bacterium]
MKQFQIVYRGEKEFTEELEKFRKNWEHMPDMMFQIFSEILKEDTIKKVSSPIEKVFPDVPWFGCSTSGNLVDCQLAAPVTVVATVFENESSRFKVLQYEYDEDSIEQITQKITEDAEANPWVKAIEMYFTIPEGSYTRFCDGLKNIRSGVHIFGGVSCSDDITSSDCCVFSCAGGYSEKSIIVVFYGGDDFYVDSIKVTGWKPLGRRFSVTKSEGSLLQELDGIPAYDVYHKYLDINNDENFFYNTLEFPLLYEHNGTTILRVPVASNADKSILMSSDIDVGSTVTISYGDPKTIVESIALDSKRIQKFCPDLLHIFSCAARRTFWTSTDPTYELEPFKDIAPSAGFFSHGEFLRENDCLNQNNVTLVIAAMREGEAEQAELQNDAEIRTSRSKIPLVSRFATFITATSLELEEMNKKLMRAAVTDRMTELYNRAETNKRIGKSLADIESEKLSLIMMDIDNFKRVNDTYGHQEGDNVIIALSDILRNEQERAPEKISAGRWGGEEFMLVLSGTGLEEAAAVADNIRKSFAGIKFTASGSQTVSVGVTEANPEDTFDILCTRVDTALYEAKKTGKNKVVTL